MLRLWKGLIRSAAAGFRCGHLSPPPLVMVVAAKAAAAIITRHQVGGWAYFASKTKCVCVGLAGNPLEPP